jgi:chromosome segregation ATPase
VREIHASDGILHVRYSEHDTRTYTVHNVDAKPKTLIVEQTDSDEYNVISPKPSERAAKANRFEVKVPANGNQILKVEEEHITLDAESVSDATPDWLATMLVNKELSEHGKAQLQAISDVKQHLVEANSALADARSQLEDLTGDQTRLRQNIDSLNRVKGQEDLVRKYSGQLSDNEATLSNLRDQIRNLEQRKADLEKQQRELIQKLDF